jgi:tetratricopeptide (TPR) repeat protein
LERARSNTPDQMLVYWQALARVRRIRGEFARAKTLLEEALASYPEDEPHCQVEMVVRPELALNHVEMGAIEDAVAQVSRCREVSAGEDWRGLEGHLARAEAVVAAATSKLDEAETGFARAVTIFRKYALPWEEADTLQRWGRVIATAEPVQAIEKFDAAIEIYRRHGAGQRWIDRVEADKHRGQPLIESEQTVVVSSKLGGEAIFRNEGEFWTIGFASRSFRLRNMKGLAYIAYLLAHPGERIHVCDLVTIVEGSAGDDSGVADAVARTASDGIAVARDLGDGVPMLDHQAKAQYRARLSELRKELEEAERMNDSGTAERIRQELEFVDDELSAAVGLGGRDRKMSDHAERARLRIGKAIRYSLSGILEHDLSLGHHFSTCIRTGYFCAYTPDPSHRQSWKL